MANDLYIGNAMGERRFVKANPHAIPLLLDIMDSTADLGGGSLHQSQLIQDMSSHPAAEATLGAGEYYLGFEDHFPFGFVGLKALDDCGELCGPFVYHDYLGKGYGEFLFAQILEIAREKDLRLLFTMIPKASDNARDFLFRNGFDLISSDLELVKRWRDGLLAERKLETNAILLARLIGQIE